MSVPDPIFIDDDEEKDNVAEEEGNDEAEEEEDDDKAPFDKEKSPSSSIEVLDADAVRFGDEKAEFDAPADLRLAT